MPNLGDVSTQRRQVQAPILEWVPDHPQFRNPGIFNLRNGWPADTGLYKPVQGIVTEGSNGLKDLVPGVTNNAGQLQSFRDVSSNRPFYYTAAVDPVADDFHLFQYDEQGSVWSDVSPAVVPNAVFDGHAYFSQFGNRVYAATGATSPLLAKDIGTATAFATIANAPRFVDAVVIRGFLMGVNFVRETPPGGVVTTGVSWSGINDPENWIDPVADPSGALSALRGETELEGGGRLLRILPGIGGADAIIFGQFKIWRVTFIGPPGVWDFQVVEEAEGTVMPTSVVSDGQLIFFRGRRGWMTFDGARAQPIGAGKVDFSFIRREGNEDFAFNGGTLGGFNRGIRSAVSGEPYADNVAMFLFRSDVNSSSEAIQADDLSNIETDQLEPIEATVSSQFQDTMLFVNKLTGAWGNAKLPLQCIARVETNVTRTDAPRMVGLNENLQLVTFDGANLETIFDTAEVTGDANNIVTIRNVWPYVNNNNCTIRLFVRNKLGDVQEIQNPRFLEEDASIPINESGRFVSLRITMPAGEDWPDGFVGFLSEFADLGIGGNA